MPRRAADSIVNIVTVCKRPNWVKSRTEPLRNRKQTGDYNPRQTGQQSLAILKMPAPTKFVDRNATDLNSFVKKCGEKCGLLDPKFGAVRNAVGIRYGVSRVT
jgi:hypothetical protein